MKLLKKIFEPIFNIKYIFKEPTGKSVEEMFQEMWVKKTREHINELLKRGCSGKENNQQD